VIKINFLPFIIIIIIIGTIESLFIFSFVAIFHVNISFSLPVLTSEIGGLPEGLAG